MPSPHRYPEPLDRSKLAAVISTLAAVTVVAATFWQWWDIGVDGAMMMRRWVRVMLMILALALLASLGLLLAS